MTILCRMAPLLFVSILGACSTMYGARISVTRPGPAPAFTDQEKDTAKAIVVEIARAARFADANRAERLSGSYVVFVALSGKGSEQDTVDVSGMMRADRREILVSVGDWMNGDPLPATRTLVADLRAALARAFPDSHVEVETRNKPRILGP